MHEDIATLVKDSLAKARKQIGHANVLIAGKTGVGKSTLVNAIFQGELATTGIGRPVTQNTREYSKDGIPLTIIDTKGIEAGAYQQTRSQLEEALRTRNASRDAGQHVHVAWLCIAEDSRRVEQAEIDLLALLEKYRIPTVVVITKARSDNGFRAEVEKLLPGARQFVRVRALREELDDGPVLEPMGLRQLVEVTAQLFPDGHKNAFVAAQKVDLQHKVERSHVAVGTAALAAGTVGATPIPFADAVGIVPVQVTMIVTISGIFGLKLSESFVTTLVATAVTTVGGTLAGRAAVGSLLKLIPGVGSVVGGAVSAATAAALTTAFGEAYILTLRKLFAAKMPAEISAEEVAREFVHTLKAPK